MAVLRMDACEASVQLLPRGLLPLAPGSRRGRGGGASQAYGPPGSGLPACGLPRRRPLLTDSLVPVETSQSLADSCTVYFITGFSWLH